jgi:hypothetical protein
MIACRTHHDLSSASSTIAGSKLSDNSSMLITVRPVLVLIYEDDTKPTSVYSLQLADDIESNFGEITLQKVQKEGQQVFDRHGSLFSKQGR